MAHFYWHFYLLSILFSNLPTGAHSALYPTQPVADTVFFCGDSALITWVDTKRKPHVSGLGPLTIKLHTNEDDFVATLAQNVNPLSYGTLVSIPLDLRNETLYVLRFSALGLSEDVWTADFSILPKSSDLKSSLQPTSLAGSATVHENTPVRSLLQPPSILIPSAKQTHTTDMIPISTVTSNPPDSMSSPPMANGAVYSRADRLDQAWFRLLFIVWPAMFGLSMAL